MEEAVNGRCSLGMSHPTRKSGVAETASSAEVRWGIGAEDRGSNLDLPQPGQERSVDGVVEIAANLHPSKSDGKVHGR